MRPLLLAVIAALTLGSVKAFTLFQNSLPPPQIVQPVIVEAEGKFTVDFTLTFDAQPDEFEIPPTSLIVSLHGEEVLRHTKTIKAGVPFVVEVADVHEGSNPFFIQVFVGDEGFDLQRAVRVRILRDGDVIAEDTVWSPPGEPVKHEINLDVPKHGHAVEPHQH